MQIAFENANEPKSFLENKIKAEQIAANHKNKISSRTISTEQAIFLKTLKIKKPYSKLIVFGASLKS